MDHEIPRALLDLQQWDQLALHECAEIARFVADLLPPTFSFAGVETYDVGGQRHHVALFAGRIPSQPSPISFALIPGGTVTLGYDRTRPFAFPEDLIREWQEYHLEYHGDRVTIDGDLIKDILPIHYHAFYAYLDRIFLPLRTVTLRPFLLQTVVQQANQLLLAPLMTFFRAHVNGRKSYGFQGGGPIPHQYVVTFLQQQGFRLPSSDEWEYACSAGSHTLFYWGNFREGGDEAGRDAPLNAFGLRIAQDSYLWEYCDDPTLMRGGDGGVTVCGWAGVLAASLPLASAYYLRLREKEINNGVYSPCFRRVFDLAPFLKKGADAW